MFAAKPILNTDKPAFYAELCGQLAALLEGETDPIANAANTSALIFQSIPNLNWAGFYFLKTPDELVLGPFQGKPACVRIAAGKGVCGAAVERRAPILVDDVYAFPGHIFCDGGSRAELVAPLLHEGRVLGVLDLDSPTTGHFDADDQAGVERLAQIYVSASVWTA